MGIIACGPDGKPAKIEGHDRDVVEQFQRMLVRNVGRHPLEAYFDGDTHLDTPLVADRDDYMIDRDGTVVVAPATDFRKAP
jgi:hypothetical protein